MSSVKAVQQMRRFIMWCSLPVFSAVTIRREAQLTTYFPQFFRGVRRIKLIAENGAQCTTSRLPAVELESVSRTSTYEDRFMSDETTGSQDFVRIPIFQRILDNPFILLFVGVVVPAVFYVIWGIMEIVSIPIAR